LKNDRNTFVKELKDRVAEFIRVREWERFHNPKDLAESICIEAAELLQLFQWVSNAEALEYDRDSVKLKRVGEEIADILIYSLSLSNVLGLDATQNVLKKIEVNERKYPVEKYKGRFK